MTKEAKPRSGPDPAQVHSGLRKRMWPTILLGAAILVCGIVIGSGGTILWIRYKFDRMRHDPDRMTTEITSRIRAKLGLSDEQTERVAKILREGQGAVGARIQTEMQRMRGEVAAVLTPEQAQKWNDDFDSIMFGPLGGPPPPPDR